MEYLLKASAVIAIFFVCYKICLQRDTFFEQNRWFLLAGLVVAAFLPFIVIPIYIEAQPTNFDYLVFVEDNIATAPTSNSFDILSLLNFIYVLGVIVFSLRFIFQITSLLPLIINSEKQRIDGYNFVKTHQNISPFSFFNYIVYNPKPFNESELEQIVTHEKVHVNQHHSIDILLSQISCIIFWFNPLVWFYNKDLKQNLEFIADKEAIHYTNCKKSYQYTLLKTSMPNQSLALTNNFYNSLIKKRIVMLHKSKSKKINLIKFTLIIPALALFLMSFNSKTVIIEKKPTKETIDKTSNNLLQEPYKVIITKDASKENLDQIIEEAKTKGVTLKFKGIKRNSNNEIIAISASFKNENGSGNYHLKGDKPITSFAYYQKKDSFGFASVSNELKKITFVSEDGEKHEINHLDSDTNVFVYSSDGKTYSDKEVDKVIIKSKDSFYIKKINMKPDLHEDLIFMIKDNDDDDGKVYKLKKAKIKDVNENLIWKTDEEFISNPVDDKTKKIEKTIKVITKDSDKNIEITSEYKDDNKIIVHKSNDNKAQVKFKSSDGKEPLILVDGKEISKEEMDDIKPVTIESVNVLKGDNATKKYGEKAKDGVIEIILKK